MYQVVIICQPQEGNFRRSPRAEFGCGAVFPPGTPSAAVCGERGAVARARGVGWRSGAAGVKKLPGTLERLR